jgi:hypothetical protein
MAQALVIVLKQAGNDLSRENIMKAATNLPDTTTLPMVAGDQDQLQSDRLQADEEHAVGSVRREDVQARSGVTPFCVSFGGWCVIGVGRVPSPSLRTGLAGLPHPALRLMVLPSRGLASGFMSSPQVE